MKKKIDQIQDFFKNNQTHVVMLSKKGKWITRTTDLMSSKMEVLGRETMCYCADNKAHKTTDSKWLQGGLMNVTTGKISSLMQCHKEK